MKECRSCLSVMDTGPRVDSSLREDGPYDEANKSGFLTVTAATLTRLVAVGLALDRRTRRKQVRESIPGPGPRTG